MSEQTLKKEVEEKTPVAPNSQTRDKPDWETPQIQDVSEEVMAQPYIRFT